MSKLYNIFGGSALFSLGRKVSQIPAKSESENVSVKKTKNTGFCKFQHK
jgi:hypothetical protein